MGNSFIVPRNNDNFICIKRYKRNRKIRIYIDDYHIELMYSITQFSKTTAIVKVLVSIILSKN